MYINPKVMIGNLTRNQLFSLTNISGLTWVSQFHHRGLHHPGPVTQLYKHHRQSDHLYRVVAY